jgi:peptidoglycan/LPS O-acetylase OafA/YrhL
MGFYVIWPYLVVTIIIVLFASTPLLQLADVPPTIIPARVDTIDGLRGFLALDVFFHHAAIYHQYSVTGRWALPPSRFYVNLGLSGVAMFFMVTGYLFWARMLRVKGRPDFLRLYIGRAFRIIPLYLLLAFVVLLSVGILTGWRLKETPLELATDVATWLGGGIFLGGAVNGYYPIQISAGVTWSLPYEWKFYASLLVTSLFARQFILGALLPVILLLATVPFLVLHPGNLDLACALMFFVGMTTASAKQSIFVEPTKTSQWAMSIAVVGCITFTLLSFDTVFDARPIIILGFAFWLIVSGTTMFGLLLTRPAKRLGDISYGIYLLQGPILFLAFSSSFVRPFITASPWAHWAAVTISAISLVILATITHALIERPGIVAGQWVSGRLVWPREKRSVSPTCGRLSKTWTRVAKAGTDIEGLIRKNLDAVGGTGDTALTAFTDGCPGLRGILAAAGILEPPILDWFHSAMRLQHLKQIGDGLAAGDPVRAAAKAVIVTEVERLHWRIWNGKAKNARKSIDRIGAVRHHFRGERDSRKSIAPVRKLWTALRARNRYLIGQSAWLVNYAERHRAGLRVGTAITGDGNGPAVEERCDPFLTLDACRVVQAKPMGHIGFNPP